MTHTVNSPAGASISRIGMVALIIGHCAGLVDLIALPVWVGALIARFGFSPQEGGALVTLFLLGAVLASVLTAKNFNRIPHKSLAVIGYGGAALTFFLASQQTAFTPLAVLHFIGGLANGVALSLVHGTMGRSKNPHRMFAFAGAGLGFLGMVYMGAVPNLLALYGGPVLFLSFGVIMLIATVVSLLAFPNVMTTSDAEKQPQGRFPRAVLIVITGVSLMTFNQAMVFSFVEVIGHARNFAPHIIVGALIALGVVNFVGPAPLAGLLEKRISARSVVMAGPAVQAVLALILTFSTVIVLWVPAAAVFVSVQIFTHTFVFGLLSRMDTTGRAAAATPAMLMIGSALGPMIGGVLIEGFAIEALGLVAVVISGLSIMCFFKGTSAIHN